PERHRIVEDVLQRTPVEDHRELTAVRLGKTIVEVPHVGRALVVGGVEALDRGGAEEPEERLGEGVAAVAPDLPAPLPRDLERELAQRVAQLARPEVQVLPSDRGGAGEVGTVSPRVAEHAAGLQVYAQCPRLIRT